MVIMTKSHEAYLKYLTELDQRDLDLIRQKKAVAAFLTGDHTIQQSQELLVDLRRAELELASSLEEVVKIRTATYFRKEASKICERGREIGEHVKDIDRMLIGDIIALNSSEKKEKADVLKNTTFLLGVPGFMLAAVKNGIGSNYLGPYQALTLGLAMSSGVLLRKRIRDAFCEVGRNVYAFPREVRESFTIYYVKETIKDKRSKIVLLLGINPKRKPCDRSAITQNNTIDQNKL